MPKDTPNTECLSIKSLGDLDPKTMITSKSLEDFHLHLQYNPKREKCQHLIQNIFYALSYACYLVCSKFYLKKAIRLISTSVKSFLTHAL